MLARFTTFLGFFWLNCLLFVSHLVTNQIGILALNALTEVTCDSQRVFLQCVYPPDSSFDAALYATLLVLAGGTLLWLQAFKRNGVIYPFGMLWCMSCIGAMAFDYLSSRGIANNSELLNSAMNALSVGLFVSLAIVLLVTVGRRQALLRFLFALIATACIKILAIVGFAAIEPYVRGSLELWTLYCVFWFGAFNLHIGAVVVAFAGSDNRGLNWARSDTA